MGAIHPRDLGTILSIWAHPDDETYLAGGVMAAASANGLEDDLGVYMTDERPVGVPPAAAALHLRLGGAALDQKLTALRAMATQTGGLMAAVSAPTFAEPVAEEAFVAAPRRDAPPLRAAATPALA